eukprot:5327008-Ditylum_brightwellii.AAC.1
MLRAKHMLVQRDPTEMNRQFTYGSQQSSNSLAVDSHRPRNTQQAPLFFQENNGGGNDNKKNILFVTPATPPK